MNIDKNILEVPIEDIIPNRFQPRLAFNEEGINELSESIKQHGIIQPLVVRKLGDKYEIIAGERRYKASTMAGLTKVPVIISDIDDNKSAEVALVENIQRRNLTAIEEAKSYKNLLDRGYMTQEQLANKMGVSQSAIANKLRLLNLDEEVQDALLNEKISERHARSLLVLDDKEEQKKWLKRIMEERLTVRQLDMELKKRGENGGEEEGIPLVNINPNLDEIVSQAEDIHVERAPHDVASMLIPEGGIKIEEPKEENTKSPNKFFNFLEDEQANMNVIEPDEILNTFTSTPVLETVADENITTPNNEVETEKEVSPSVPSLEEILNPSPAIEEVKPIESTNDSLETLDLLEDLNTPTIETVTNEPAEEEPVVIEEIEPIVTEPIMQNVIEPVASIEVIDQNESKEVPTEIQIPEVNVDAPINENILNTPILEPIQEEPIVSIEQRESTPVIEDSKPIMDTPIMVESQNQTTNNQIIEEHPITEHVIEEAANEEIKPFKSIFFNSEDDEEESNSNQVVSPIISNTIEEVKPVIEEPFVDPLDSIVTLEPGYQERQEELAGTDLKTAINVVRDTVSDLEKRGFVVECEEADLEEIYHITIKIDKNNK